MTTATSSASPSTVTGIGTLLLRHGLGGTDGGQPRLGLGRVDHVPGREGVVLVLGVGIGPPILRARPCGQGKLEPPVRRADGRIAEQPLLHLGVVHLAVVMVAMTPSPGLGERGVVVIIMVAVVVITVVVVVAVVPTWTTFNTTSSRDVLVAGVAEMRRISTTAV